MSFGCPVDFSFFSHLKGKSGRNLFFFFFFFLWSARQIYVGFVSGWEWMSGIQMDTAILGCGGWHTGSRSMEMHLKTLKPARGYGALQKAQSWHTAQWTKTQPQHARQDISREVFEGCFRAIGTAFLITLPREPTPPITFDLILPWLKSVVNFFVACSGVHDSVSIQGLELQKG